MTEKLYLEGSNSNGEDEWDDICVDLTNLMRELDPDINNYWRAEVENFGWRNRSGYSNFHAKDGTELFFAVLPKTDCYFKIYVDEDTKTIRINNAHHDKPMGGEWYTIRPFIKEIEEEE